MYLYNSPRSCVGIRRLCWNGICRLWWNGICRLWWYVVYGMYLLYSYLLCPLHIIGDFSTETDVKRSKIFPGAVSLQIFIFISVLGVRENKIQT